MISSKIDSTALFHDLAVGGAQRSGFITLLAIADALSKVLYSKVLNKSHLYRFQHYLIMYYLRFLTMKIMGTEARKGS